MKDTLATIGIGLLFIVILIAVLAITPVAAIAMLLLDIILMPFQYARYRKRRKLVAATFLERPILIYSSANKWQHFVEWNREALTQIHTLDVTIPADADTAMHILRLAKLGKREFNQVAKAQSVLLLTFQPNIARRWLGTFLFDQDNIAMKRMSGRSEKKLLKSLQTHLELKKLNIL